MIRKGALHQLHCWVHLAKQLDRWCLYKEIYKIIPSTHHSKATLLFMQFMKGCLKYAKIDMSKSLKKKHENQNFFMRFQRIAKNLTLVCNNHLLLKWTSALTPFKGSALDWRAASECEKLTPFGWVYTIRYDIDCTKCASTPYGLLTIGPD